MFFTHDLQQKPPYVAHDLQQNLTHVAHDLQQKSCIFAPDLEQEFMFRRHILKKLEAWKANAKHKPLILRGARQVGKTTVVNEFGTQFDNYLYFNLENPESIKLFEMEIPLDDLVNMLYASLGKSQKVAARSSLSTRYKIHPRPSLCSDISMNKDQTYMSLPQAAYWRTWWMSK